MVQNIEMPLPTLLQSRAVVQEVYVKAADKEPLPQMFGARLSSVDEEEDMEAADVPPEHSMRKCEDELLKEEDFWTKAQEALEERSRREKLLQFLKANRFKDVNSSSGWFFNYCFPLHVAVEQNNAAMVDLLLHFKAKTKLKDASGETARLRARKLNVSGSHDKVLKVFAEHTAARKKRAAARRAARMEQEKKAAGLALVEPDLELGFQGGAAKTGASEVTEEAPQEAPKSEDGI